MIFIYILASFAQINIIYIQKFEYLCISVGEQFFIFNKSDPNHIYWRFCDVYIVLQYYDEQQINLCEAILWWQTDSIDNCMWLEARSSSHIHVVVYWTSDVQY